MPLTAPVAADPVAGYAAAPRVYVGTSGFSFEDWRGPVYPERLPAAQWLTYYEQQLGFNTLEINYTYYQQPSHRTLNALLQKTTPAFRFSIKAHRSMTHDMLRSDGTLADDPHTFDTFRTGMAPLVDSGRLGGVLLQFPTAFTDTPRHRVYLGKALDRLEGLPRVVELRHRSWVRPELFAYLRKRQASWCVVDEPALPALMPWVGETTSDTLYLRLHGRNAAQWFGTSTNERYHYCYSDAELQELAARLQPLLATVTQLFVYGNNHFQGHAVRNAQHLRGLLPASAASRRPA